MEESITKLRKRTFLVYWILATSLGWSMRIVDIALIKQWEIRTLAELPSIMIFSTIGGLTGGLIIGLGQQQVLHRVLSKQSNDWWWKTVIGNCLLAPIGIGIITLIAWSFTTIRGEVFLPESKTMSLFLYPTYLFYGGIILGILQWSGFRNILEKKRWKETSLWILGIWTSIGLGIFVGMIVSRSVLQLNPQFASSFAIEQIVTGVIYGITSGVIVLILLGRLTHPQQADSESISQGSFH